MQIRSSKRHAEFFENKLVSRYLTFGWFYGSEKLFFTTKLFIKRERQNIKKIPHNVLEKNYLANHLNLCKIGELELLKYVLFINVFKQIC